MKQSFVILLVFCFGSCDKEKIEIREEFDIVGQWDSYFSVWDNGQVGRNGPSYSVLFNYEQGFEILENETYLSRYNRNGTPETSGNVGTWRMNADSITFYYVRIDGIKESMTYDIVKLEDNELRIKSKSGLTHYLNKSL